MTFDIPIVIIGGGVIGCAIARELSRAQVEMVLFEKNPGITKGENQSSRNSGVIHSGIYYDQKTRPEKTALCVEGNALLYRFCDDHRVPALKTGKLIVATNVEEDEQLDLYLNRAKENGVESVEKITGPRIAEMEPNVTGYSALLVPSAGIVEPTSLVYRLHTLAHQQGVHFVTGTEVTDIQGQGDMIQLSLRYPDGKKDKLNAGVVINAAGIYADRIARLLNPNSPYELDPVRGESYKFYGNKRTNLKLTGMNVYPTPEAVVTPHGRHFTVGIHLTPTFENLSFPFSISPTVTVGPKLVPMNSRNDTSGNWSPASIFFEKVQTYFPGIQLEDLVWHQAGIQARLKNAPDFTITSDPKYPQFINLLGIDSPGLTACLAIARRVKKMVDNLGIIS